MSALPIAARVPSARRHMADRLGDGLLFALTALASLVAVVAVGAIAYKVIDGARGSIAHFGIGFVSTDTWNPNPNSANPVFGAASSLFGTAVTSLSALTIATPLAVAIGLYLSLLAPGRAAAAIGPLVELLAAIPSVVLGLWGLVVLAPFLSGTVEPALNSVIGWIPLFGAPSPTGLGMFNACLILTIMVVPIVASISRDLFTSVPLELKDGALALGATRWEMIRGVVLGSTRPGLVAAAVLGLGRALGEAIAVSQVIGGGNTISANLFTGGNTIASRIAVEFPGNFPLHESSLFYLAVVLLIIGLVTNLAAQAIVRNYERRHGRSH